MINQTKIMRLKGSTVANAQKQYLHPMLRYIWVVPGRKVKTPFMNREIKGCSPILQYPSMESTEAEKCHIKIFFIS